MKQKKIQYIMMLALSVLLLPALTSCLGKNLMLPERSLATASTEATEKKKGSAQEILATKEQPDSEVDANLITEGIPSAHLDETLELEKYYMDKKKWPHDQTQEFTMKELGKAVNGLAIEEKGVCKIRKLLHPDGLKKEIKETFKKFAEKETFKKINSKAEFEKFAIDILETAVTMTLNKIEVGNNKKNNKKNNNEINIRILKTLTKSIYSTKQGIFTAHTCKVVFERVSEKPKTLTDLQKSALRTAIDESCLSDSEKKELGIMPGKPVVPKNISKKTRKSGKKRNSFSGDVQQGTSGST